MQGTQFLAGVKTYAIAFIVCAFAVAAGTILPAPYHLAPNAAIEMFLGGLGLAGLRSGLTTEVQKVATAFGVDPREFKSVGDASNTILQRLQKLFASLQPTRVVPVLLAAILVIGVLSVQGCATSPAQTVAQAESGYTVLANLAAGYCESAGHDAGVCATLRELNAAIDVKGADGQRHGALIAARAAAESGDAAAATAANVTLQAAIAALAGFEAAHSVKK